MAEAATPNEIDYASLLCSRLCHDLLSPVGALNNGIELLADETDPRMREQCLALLAESARTTAGKLKFFRLAFGAAGGFGEAIAVHEIRTALEGMFPPGGKLTLDWLIDGEALPKPAAKLLLNLALMTGESLPRGGTLTLGSEQRGNVVEIVVRGEGPKLTFAPELRASFAPEAAGEPVTTRTATSYLIRALVAQAGGQLALSGPDDPFLMFGASLPV
ncbi:MAG TPA: histidine phosphotransferase family protein [Sphingobium sp.]|nr:histidine phosphotransferase family protein [Sphingobium sp.]